MAHELGLLHKGQADHRPGAPLNYVRVLRKEALTRSVLQNYTLSSADYVTKERLGQLGGCHQRLPQSNLNLVAATPGFRLDPMSFASLQDQNASLGPSVLDCDYHERLDQASPALSLQTLPVTP